VGVSIFLSLRRAVRQRGALRYSEEVKGMPCCGGKKSEKPAEPKKSAEKKSKKK
jgi:hypothetical protein